MKKYVLLTAMALILAAPGVALSQTAPTGNGGPPPGTMQGGAMHGPGQEDGKRFEERKAEILRHIDEHLAEVMHRKQCVEAANDHQALRACMPQGEHGGEGHEGGQQGGHP